MPSQQLYDCPLTFDVTVSWFLQGEMLLISSPTKRENSLSDGTARLGSLGGVTQADANTAWCTHWSSHLPACAKQPSTADVKASLALCCALGVKL